MLIVRVRYLCVLLAWTAALLLTVSTTSTGQLVRLGHDRGQTIAPVFEGWEPNPDGTFSLHFGYMNRNYKEEPDIAIGPNNRMEPGGSDRGQATHFLPRRHKNVFRVIVPSDFGDQKLVWNLSIRGHTETVPGSLDPRYQIETLRDPASGNTAPVVKLGSDQIVTLPATATRLTVAVMDDGKPKRRGEDSPVGVTVEWSKYRGPGLVTFDPEVQKVEDGKATTGATFDTPGVYVIRAVANDGSRGGTACCWTNAQMTVTVQ